MIFSENCWKFIKRLMKPVENSEFKWTVTEQYALRSLREKIYTFPIFQNKISSSLVEPFIWTRPSKLREKLFIYKFLQMSHWMKAIFLWSFSSWHRLVHFINVQWSIYFISIHLSFYYYKRKEEDICFNCNVNIFSKKLFSL